MMVSTVSILVKNHHSVQLRRAIVCHRPGEFFVTSDKAE
jgi:hypothetical protein